MHEFRSGRGYNSATGQYENRPYTIIDGVPHGLPFWCSPDPMPSEYNKNTSHKPQLGSYSGTGSETAQPFKILFFILWPVLTVVFIASNGSIAFGAFLGLVSALLSSFALTIVGILILGILKFVFSRAFIGLVAVGGLLFVLFIFFSS